MKISTAAIALLGLPAALTAAAATHPDLQDVPPTSPSTAELLPDASPPPPSALTRARTLLSHLFQAYPAPPCEAHTPDDLPPHHGLRKRDHHGAHAHTAASSSSSSSAAASGSKNHTHVPVVNTFTTHPKSLTTSRITSTVTSAPSVTQLGVFTAGNIVWTITSAAGVEAVDGKTLIPGGNPINIAGAEVSEKATGGKVVAGGARVVFTTYSATSSAAGSSAAAAGSSGAGSSSAAAAGGRSSSSSSGGAGAMVTAGVGAVVGGVVALGALVL